MVVFEVGGVIRGNIRITKPYLTIAGQTAPGAGITVEGVLSTYDHGVHDVIVRHLRVRRRSQPPAPCLAAAARSFPRNVGGSLIHLLLVVAVVVLIINLVTGRRAV